MIHLIVFFPLFFVGIIMLVRHYVKHGIAPYSWQCIRCSLQLPPMSSVQCTVCVAAATLVNN